MEKGGGAAPLLGATIHFLLRLLVGRFLLFFPLLRFLYFLLLLVVFLFFLLSFLRTVGPTSPGRAAVFLAVPIVVISQSNSLTASAWAWCWATPGANRGGARVATNKWLCSGAVVYKPAVPAA